MGNTVYSEAPQCAIWYHIVPEYTMGYRSVSQCTTVCHGVLQYTKGYHSIPRYHGTLWYTEVPSGTLRYTVEQKATKAFQFLVIECILQNRKGIGIDIFSFSLMLSKMYVKVF